MFGKISSKRRNASKKMSAEIAENSNIVCWYLRYMPPNDGIYRENGKAAQGSV
jgi:hypothetical protein